MIRFDIYSCKQILIYSRTTCHFSSMLGILGLFEFTLQLELNDTIRQLNELVKGKKYDEVLTLANQGLQEDPNQIRYVYFRAQAKENLN